MLLMYDSRLLFNIIVIRWHGSVINCMCFIIIIVLTILLLQNLIRALPYHRCVYFEDTNEINCWLQNACSLFFLLAGNINYFF